MNVLSADQMQSLDRRTIHEAGIPGSVLMERAGAGVVAAMEHEFGRLSGLRITVCCGKGNNGGDGFVIGRLLHRKRIRVRILLMTRVKDLRGDALTMYRKFVARAGAAAVVANPSETRIRSILESSDVAVDALLGTGLSSPVSDRYRAVVEALNASSCPVVAVDLPTGIHSDSGEVLGMAVRARLTVTFGCPKLGLYTGAGIDHAGSIQIVDIGIPRSYVEALDSPVSLISREDVALSLPVRHRSSHKGTFGHAGIIAGSVGKTGAAALAGRAALRTGAGLVTLAVPSRANAVLESKLLEVMTVPMPDTEAGTLARAAMKELLAFIQDRTAIAIGPGLTTHPETVALVQAILKKMERPCVIDADGLNALANSSDPLHRCKAPAIVTPHPGEMARLLSSTPRLVNEDRITSARSFADTHRSTVVLKGARTIVAHPNGFVAICPTGNPGMATAGTGDVLTGMLVSLLAQQLEPWDAACAAVYLHGLAGDLAARDLGEAGMIAGDLLARIPMAIEQTIRAA